MLEAQESTTAKLCAFARAYHSSWGREKIFDDYLAYDMMGKEEYDRLCQQISGEYAVAPYRPTYGFESTWGFDELNRFFAPIALSRIAFAEEELLEFARSYSRSQYVICGAGLDTFAFRNPEKSLAVFELDHPSTQAHKLHRINQLRWDVPENVTYAAVDFTKDSLADALLSKGFQPKVPTFFSILGVTYYLQPEDLAKTFRQINRVSVPGDLIVFDFPDETTFAPGRPRRVRELTDITDRLGEPMQHGYSYEEIAALLSAQGYEVKLHATPEFIQQKYFGRRLDKQRAFENIHFILAEKRKKA